MFELSDITTSHKHLIWTLDLLIPVTYGLAILSLGVLCLQFRSYNYRVSRTVIWILPIFLALVVTRAGRLQDDSFFSYTESRPVYIVLQCVLLIAIGPLVRQLVKDLHYMHSLEGSLKVNSQLYNLLAEASSDLILVLDTDRTIQYVSPSSKRVLGLEPSAVMATSIPERRTAVHPDDLTRYEAIYTAPPDQVHRCRVRLKMHQPDWTWYEVSLTPIIKSGVHSGWIGRITDVHDEETANRELAVRLQEQKILTEINHMALTGTDLNQLFQYTCDLIVQNLGVDYAKILQLTPRKDMVKLVAGTGWKEGLVGHVQEPFVRSSVAGFTISAGQPTLVRDLATEDRFEPSNMLKGHDVRSGASCVIHNAAGVPWGVLSIFDRKPERFDEHHMDFCAAATASLSGAIARSGIDALQQHLISVAAHELKTPLTVLVGHAQLLKRYAAGNSDDRIGMAVEKILIETTELESLISNLLQVEPATLGIVTLRRESVDLSEILGSAIDRMQLVHSTDRITFERPPGTVHGYWDHQKLDQIMINLLDNALKYSQGTVTCRLRPSAENVAVDIMDTGQGITELEQTLMFNTFYRSPRSKESASGLGIGLGITKAFVDAHCGSIDVLSAIGIGTTITVTLPYQ